MIAISPLVIIAGIIYSVIFFPDPTCSDGIQNQGEVGVDCGDVCGGICQAPLPEVDIVWDRSFQVSDSIYNAVAYIENPNTDLVAYDVPYRFQIYDTNNILITERRGEMDILSQPITAAFAAGINTRDREVGRTEFEFTENPFWEEPNFETLRFEIRNRDFDLTDNPRLSLDILNSNTQPVRNIVLTAFIFDTNGDAVHVSQTTVSDLGIQESESVIFTWREPFSEEDGVSYQIEIVPVSYELGQ
ncbi:MAG: hypothetical protein WD335_04110 [Candidatus Paceibacterota bacterium]